MNLNIFIISVPNSFSVTVKILCLFGWMLNSSTSYMLQEAAEACCETLAKFCLFVTHFIWLEKCRETFVLASSA